MTHSLLTWGRAASWKLVRSGVAGPAARSLSHAVAAAPPRSPLRVLALPRALLKGEVSAPRLLEITGVLDETGIAYWLAGGWGIDALVGHQTRHHDDLDVVVEDFSRDAPAALSALSTLGFGLLERRHQPVWMPDQWMLEDAHSSRIDVLSIDWELLRARAPELASDAVFSTGTVAGQPVPCLSHETQRLFHSGFEPRSVERHDLALLS